MHQDQHVLLRYLLRLVVLVNVLFIHALPALAQIGPVPALSPVAGAVVRVSTAAELQMAVASITSGTTVLVAPGFYPLTRTLSVRGVTDVAIRGEAGDRDAVVLTGTGMSNPVTGDVPFGIWAGDDVDGLLVANLTLRDFNVHPIILNAGVRRAHLYNVRLLDAGQQFLKSNPDRNGKGNDFGIVEYSVFEFTSTGRDDYPKAIDLHGATGWIIRHNLFRNIRAPEGQLNGPAVLAWRGSRGTIVEHNVFINCQREIVLGAEESTPHSHEGGVVQDNFVYREPGMRGDTAISLWDSPGTQVLRNRSVLSGTYPTAIEFRFPGTRDVVIANNITDAAVVARDGGSATVTDHLSLPR
jgi:hypothetical protein